MKMQAQQVVSAALALGILMPAGASAVTLESAGAAASSIVGSSRRERSRRPKTDKELLAEADTKDYLASLPPPTEKEWCEAGGHHVFRISAKTGRKYCLPATTDRGSGERGGGERLKTEAEIQQEIAANDSFPESKPPTEKEACEGLFKEHVFIVSAKTGNKYCIALREEGGRRNEGGGQLKSQADIDREVALLDYWAQNPPPPVSPKVACEAFGDRVYVISSKGKAHCLDKFQDD